MAITPHTEPRDGDHPVSDVPLRDPLQEELLFQQEIARRRAQERREARRKSEVTLEEPDGLVQANDPVRVAKRIDRVTRFMVGDDPMQAPMDAPVTALVKDSLERIEALPDTSLAPPAVLPAEEPGRLAGEGEPGEQAVPAPVAEHLLERIINATDFMSVRYLDLGVVAQRAVGRINVRDDRGTGHGYGTGFLVSDRLLLTNHHVLPDAETARTSVIEFDYQDGVDGKPLRPDVHPLLPDRFFIANRELDFALVAVDADPDVLAKYGHCRLTAAQGTIIIGEAVTIVQHPRGDKKQIALRENQVIDIPELVVHYAADTEPGSSGSPVFNDQWEVVALHHASVATPQHAPKYAFLNEGIRISRILNFLAAAELGPDQRALIDALRASATDSSAGKQAARPERGPDGEAPTSGVTSSRDGSPAPRSDAGSYAAQAAAAEVDGAEADGSVTIEVPLRITLRLGPPRAVTGAPAGAAGATGPAEAVEGAEAISIDPDYSNRSGYDVDFLGVPLPLPDVRAWADVASDELAYHHFSVVMNRRRRLALFAAVNIDGRSASRPRRESDRWILDPRLPREEQTGEAVYRRNALDRGHLVRRLDPAWGPQAKAANDDTFHFTNSTPQHHDFNAGQTLWVGLEDYVLNNADNHDLLVSVVTGPVLHEDDPVYRGVALPRQFFKVVTMVTTRGNLSSTGYLLSQEALLDDFAAGPEEFSFGAYRTFQVPVRRIAELTGLGLDPYIAADPLDHLEAHSLPREIVRPGDILLTL